MSHKRAIVVDIRLIKPLLLDLLDSGLWGQSIEEVVSRLIDAAIIDMKRRGIEFPRELNKLPRGPQYGAAKKR